jgi:acyl-CoA synthetase (NDP forming)
VAIVGLSRPGRFGGQIYANLCNFGYTGQIYGVNPHYDTLYDQPCYPSLSALPERPDCAILATPNERLLEVMQEAADLKIPAAVIFASAYSTPIFGQPSLQARLAETAIAHNMVVCGPNCMGFFALRYKFAVSGYQTLSDLPCGNITLISHSGSMWDAFLQNRRGVAFNYAISSGNEMVTTLADYMQFALADPTTRVIALFLETVRAPQIFEAALAEAAERDIPVVALKVGRTERAARLAQAHSGALAGQDKAYDALFAYYGVRRAKSPDEMMNTLELLAAGFRPPTRFISAVLDSGGERSLLVDLAASEGVEFAAISEETTTRLAAVLEPGLDPVNPLDAWGTGNNFEQIYQEALLALDANPATGLTLFAVDLCSVQDFSSSYTQIVLASQAQLQKPLAMLVHLSAAAGEAQLARLRRYGIPVLLDTEIGLRAVRHLLEYGEYQRRRRHLQAEPIRTVPLPEEIAKLRRQLAQATTPLDEIASRQFLQAYGLTLPAQVTAASLSEALQAAETIGYPVVLKTTGGLLHKSDQAGVRLDLRDEVALVEAYQDFEARFGPAVLVQQMVPSGLELLLGLVRDAQFGLMLVLGIGGIYVELLRDSCFLKLPVTPSLVRRGLLNLRGAPLLRGARGRPAADIEAVVEAAMRLAALALDLGDLIAAIDLNPLIALPNGAVVVDALIIPINNEQLLMSNEHLLIDN